MTTEPAIEPRSSVEIATSTRGVDIRVKVYVSSPPVSEAGQAAIEEYLRVRAELEARLMKGGA